MMYLTRSISLVFIVIFVTVAISDAQSLPPLCIFDDYMTASWNDTSCKTDSTWGGYFQDSCCGIAFDGYLYLLGERANLTGKIYFDASEQRACLVSLSQEVYVLNCSFERLTRGKGGCSDFSVKDVVHNLGPELRSLDEDCNSLGYDVDSDTDCGKCLKTWEDMHGSLVNINKSSEDEVDVCRYAVLVTLTSYRISDKLWAHSLYQCLREPRAAIATEDGSRRRKMKPGLATLIGGLTGGALIIIVAAWILLKRQIKQSPKPIKDDLEEELPKDLDCMRIPIKEINSATNNLDVLNFIGQGIAGKVYKGVLWNGMHVAIKHIVSDDGHMDTFVREVTSLSHVKHPNLVALLGHCEEKTECFLVYELCPNGNLSEWLFGKEKVLSWIQRLEIAIDSARGLWFLHTFPEGCIVHRDIKPTNILLGTSFEAKLSDFGLSKVIDLGKSYVSSEVRGTFGYVDPEYHKNHHVNSYGDVYSFGIVLLQLISGRRVINLDLKKPMSLDKMAKLLTKGGKKTDFVDPKMNEEYSPEAFDLILKIALSCTTHKHLRPTMEKVVKKLENALEISTKGKDCSSFASSTRFEGSEKQYH